MPPDHPDSNERLAREALLSRVPIPRSRSTRCAPRRGAPGARSTSSSSVSAPTATRRRSSPATRRSWRPGRSSASRSRACSPPHPRLSFSLAYLNAQPLVAFLVAGEGSARSWPGSSPATTSRGARWAAETVVLADEAAAPRHCYAPGRARALGDGEHEGVVAGAGDDLERGREAVLGGPHGSASAGQPAR